MKNLILGDGQLGSLIYSITEWDYISRKKDGYDASNLDFTSLKDYNVIINCIANTDTYSEEKEKHWKVNFEFVVGLVDYCNSTGKKLVQISTDCVYAFSKSGATEEDVPVHCRNWYGYTKLLGDGYVQLKAKDYLLVRCSFKPKPFPYSKALVIQLGNFDYDTIISKLICDLINKNAFGVYNVGTEPKTIYELAKQTRPNVYPMYEKLHETMPIDVTMNCSKLQKKLGEVV